MFFIFVEKDLSMDIKSYEAILDRYFADGIEAYMPQVSINCVVFKYEHPHLKVLFHSLPGIDLWYLPGGYVKNEESLEEAAYRNLSYSGIEKVFLKQIHTFGKVERIPRPTDSDFSESSKINELISWTKKRFITVTYYGLVNNANAGTVSRGLFKEADWYDVDQLKDIALDHANITTAARKILAKELLDHPVASSLLQNCFTLNELRGLFEAILDRTIDRGTFRRKMLKLGIIEEVDEKKVTKGRPSNLYRFNQEAYDHLLKEEKKFGF